MDYNSYFMDGEFNSLEFKNEEEKNQIIANLVSKFGSGGFKVVSWETQYDRDNGFDTTDGEDMSLNDAVILATSLVDSNEVVSANVWTKEGNCVFCVNSDSDDEDYENDDDVSSIEVFLEHDGITIYHTYKDNDAKNNSPSEYWFSDGEHEFDIRELYTYHEDCSFEDIIKKAIDNREI